MYRQKPSLPSVTAAHVCQFILITSSVRVSGYSDVHVGHMYQNTIPRGSYRAPKKLRAA